MPRKKHRDPPWTPFERGSYNKAGILKRLPDGVRDQMADAREMNPKRTFRNSRYTVFVDEVDTGIGLMLHLSIKRNDQREIKDWRDLQRIKNEIAGPECEAVELYPAESRLMDTANQYHLWCLPPGHRWPFGYNGRTVSDGEDTVLQSRQRPFEDGARPEDCLTAAEAIREFQRMVTERCALCGEPLGDHINGRYCPDALAEVAQFKSVEEEDDEHDTSEQ